MDVGNLDLSQLADGIPDVLRHVHKSRLFPSSPLNLPSSLISLDQVSEVELTSEYSDFFDWDLYGSKQHRTPKSAGKSDVSMPGLTSATSEGSASTNSDPEDRSQLKAKVREAKKGDDRLTLPTLKPKGGVYYQRQIQIEDAGQAAASHTVARKGTLPSPPTSRESSVGRSIPPPDNHPSTRGKRHGPLKDPDDVAEVRNLGACLRCKYRKVKCDQKAVCSNCFDNAGKSKSDITLPEDQQMCSRKLFINENFVFPVIAKAETGRPSTGSRSQGASHHLNVYFGIGSRMGKPLILPVVPRDDILGNNLPINHQQEDIYMLDLDKISSYLSEQSLCSWSKDWNINNGVTDFQAALDALTVTCTGNASSCFHGKQLETLQKVHRMRCLFKVWSQRNFYIVDGLECRKLPPTLQSGLRQIAKSAIKRLEGDICKALGKSLDPKWTKPEERLPIWISMMQMIMMYRELYNRTKSAPSLRPNVRPPSSWEYVLHLTKDLFSTMVYMCEVCFGKKQPEELDVSGDNHKKSLQKEVNDRFSQVTFFRDGFYDGLNPRQLGSLDQILYVRLATAPKTASSKRQKSSKQRAK